MIALMNLKKPIFLKYKMTIIVFRIMRIIYKMLIFKKVRQISY
jgi:hypothetical protein